MTDFNNICNCDCHEHGRDRCSRCKPFHRAKEKPVTHQNDKLNPNLEEEA